MLLSSMSHAILCLLSNPKSRTSDLIQERRRKLRRLMTLTSSCRRWGSCLMMLTSRFLTIKTTSCSLDLRARVCQRAGGYRLRSWGLRLHSRMRFRSSITFTQEQHRLRSARRTFTTRSVSHRALLKSSDLKVDSSQLYMSIETQ